MTTHLVHAPIDRRDFNRWAGERGLVRRGWFDDGYALHILLSAMFGRGVLQPFRLFASGRRRAAALYAYADADAEMLRETAEAVAPPDCATVIDTRRLRSKPMPEGFNSGRRLGFDVRLRPVRRLARDLRDPQSGRVMRKGQEVDAYRLEVVRRFPEGWADPDTAGAKHGVTRESVYAEWLAERLGDAASLEAGNLAAFQRSRAVRGSGQMPEGPDATVHGTLSVTEPDRFADILRRGLGRHRAYGYGMLLLRPPARS
ncbi:MAG: type I-E CRISPR-associated protein Cas6/Cse3/CasE [Acidobacteriota bacterium]|nr:type I-E CRISPR-associated protein Cas6/Cse3/CasE [Acidobacteriota bacterium]